MFELRLGEAVELGWANAAVEIRTAALLSIIVVCSSDAPRGTL